MQLNLFEGDMIAVAGGYEALARLEFAKARECFGRVLAVAPDHPAAGRGLRETEFWEQCLGELAKWRWDTAVIRLWGQMAGFAFDRMDVLVSLRQALLKHLVALFPAGEAGEYWYHPPDLCLGNLYLQLGRYGEAERGLRCLLEDFPENGLLHRYRGDALWQQGRQDAARSEYAAALLLKSDEVLAETIPVPGLQTVITEQGPALAPIYGYFAGLLPLVELEAETQTDAARACEYLRQAELARTQGHHQSMVTARRALKEHAPEILADYLEWLARGDK